MEEGPRARVEHRLRVFLQGQQRERGDGRGGEEAQEVSPECLGGRRMEEAGVEERGLFFVSGGGEESERERRGGIRESKKGARLRSNDFKLFVQSRPPQRP